MMHNVKTPCVTGFSWNCAPAVAKMAMLKVYLSETFNPYFNLATEDWMFRDMDPDQRVLFLWRNQETVVIGRFQNPWKECHTQKMKDDGIFLARRQSGGGAVFHDLGNTNFTFMSGRNLYDKKQNNAILCGALKKLGIEAAPSGRNDLVVELEDGPRKISGSAFKENRDRCFHHGTLLIDADLNKLGNYLSPSKKKLVSKGIASVRSRVANLSEFVPGLDHGKVCQTIVQEFEEYYGEKAQVETLDHGHLREIGPLNDYYERLKDWNWCYGETPKFEHNFDEKFDWGHVDVNINSQKGTIKDIKIFSDTLHPEMIEYLTSGLSGVHYSPDGVRKAIDGVKRDLPMIANYLDDFCLWMCRQIV